MADQLSRRELLALGAAAASGGRGPIIIAAETATDDAALAARAARFRELILQVAMGPGGMIISFLPYDRRRPFQEGEAQH